MSSSFQITKKVRDAVVRNLRRVFSTDSIYTYVELGGPYDPQANNEYDPDNSKIDITGHIPDSHAKFPHIAVEVISGAEIRSLGPDTLRETKDSNFKTITDEIFASFKMTVSINIYTIDDTLAVDEILDRIHDQFKLVTDDLANNGIEIQNHVFNGVRYQYVRDRWYVTGSETLNIYTEWKDDLGVETTVASIPIDIQITL